MNEASNKDKSSVETVTPQTLLISATQPKTSTGICYPRCTRYGPCYDLVDMAT